jgi:alpha-galactosidase
MIEHDPGQSLFHLRGAHASYVIQVLPTGQLVNLHWGVRLGRPAVSGLRRDPLIGYGNTTALDAAHTQLSLDLECLEASPWGRGDYRRPSLLVERPDGDRGSDFRFAGYRLHAGAPVLDGLPSPYADDPAAAETLEIDLDDAAHGLRLTLVYTLFAACDAVVRSVRLENRGAEPVRIYEIASCILDFDRSDLLLTSLDGAWIREHQRHRAPLRPGIVELSSIKGTSGSSHDPFIMLEAPDATEERGDCWGFSLVYSGNHLCSVEQSPHGLARIRLGINPLGFSWQLEPGARFQSPAAVLAYSPDGPGGLSRCLHGFVRRHIVRGPWRDRPRPVLVNSWEASYFKFNEASLVSQAKAAKALGVELFVMDDGWFGKRDDDTSSLGDWRPDPRKLPGGLARLARKIRSLGLDFGLWLEPEMISVDSDLYRAHPDWLVRSPGHEPSPGRNQHFLDLSRAEVRDHLVAAIGGVLGSAEISYVKWDMNRNMADWFSPGLPTDRQGEFVHRYFLGLYDILKRLTEAHPGVLFESCASGGNRFDYGMLCYMQQIWTSDDSDAVERLEIQHGASLFAPPSVLGAHVSAVPNHQVMRWTPLETRFNVAAFGLLGYELDLRKLSAVEKKTVARQIAWYKEWREVLQFGRLHRLLDPATGRDCAWLALEPDGARGVLGWFQKLATPNRLPGRLRLAGLAPDTVYAIANRPQFVDLREYGDLVNQMLPVRIKMNGVIHNLLADNYLLPQETTADELPGDQLMSRGLRLPRQFHGAGMADDIALVGDFGSRLFELRRRAGTGASAAAGEARA